MEKQSTTKILFLDIDGVLNRDSTKETFPEGSLLAGMTAIDQVLKERFLSWLAKYPEVKVVLSSSWRRYEVAKEFLKAEGTSWIDETPRRHSPSYLNRERGTEIATWLDANDWTHYAILDDLSDMKPVGKGLVQTSKKHGVLHRHLKRIEQLLDLENKDGT